jgi:hypothetical protein
MTRTHLSRTVVGTMIVAVLLATGGIPAGAQERELPVKWDELAGVVGNRVVSLVMPDGAVLEGTVTAVRDDALSLSIRKSPDPLYPQGTTRTIPRSSVRVLQMRETRGSWRALGAAAGAGGGAVAGWALAEGVLHTSGEGRGTWREPEGPALILGLGAVGGLAGYFAGRGADRRVTYLKIVP